MPNLVARKICETTDVTDRLSVRRGLSVGSVREAELEEKITQANRILTTFPQETFALAESVLSMSEEYPTTFARALRARAMANGAQGRMDEAASDFQTAIQIAQQYSDRLLESQCLHGLANVHHYRGEFALALEQIQRANDLRREIGDDPGLMTGLNSQGAFLAEMGDLSSAVTCFFDSLRIAQQIDSGTNEALALTNIGHLKLESGEPEVAIGYLEESLAISERIGARIYQPFTLEVLASALQKSHRVEEALQVVQRGIHIAQETGNQHHEVASLCVLAHIQMERERLADAEAVLLRALEMAQALQSGRSVASIYGALGKLYIRTGDFKQAEWFLCQGLESATDRQQRQQICDMHLAFSELYSASGDFAKALASYTEYHAVYKTLQKESLENRLGAQLAHLAVQRAQQEVEIHRLRTVALAESNQENARLLEGIQKQAQRLAELAITDPLTGLYNRRFLREFLFRELSDAPPNSLGLSLALLDLDDFKQINDRFSHSIGDEVLRTTAQLIRQSVRDKDIVVRYGGEEFVVVLPEMHRSDATAFCEQVRLVIENYDWSGIHPDLQVTTSIGLADSWEDATELTGNNSSSESLLLLADKRLYQAKASGKNRIL